LFVTGAVEIHVPGEQIGPFAHRHGSHFGVGCRRAVVRRETPKGALSDLGQGALVTVEENGDIEISEPLGNRVAQLASAVAVLRINRDEGNNVDDPESRVYTLVKLEIEDVNGVSNEPAHVTFEIERGVDESEDRTIVKGVRVAIDETLTRSVFELAQ
jgi:hypothetical protein